MDLCRSFSIGLCDECRCDRKPIRHCLGTWSYLQIHFVIVSGHMVGSYFTGVKARSMYCANRGLVSM
jgi:hypothetical protein